MGPSGPVARSERDRVDSRTPQRAAGDDVNGPHGGPEHPPPTKADSRVGRVPTLCERAAGCSWSRETGASVSRVPNLSEFLSSRGRPEPIAHACDMYSMFSFVDELRRRVDARALSSKVDARTELGRRFHGIDV